MKTKKEINAVRISVFTFFATVLGRPTTKNDDPVNQYWGQRWLRDGHDVHLQLEMLEDEQGRVMLYSLNMCNGPVCVSIQTMEWSEVQKALRSYTRNVSKNIIREMQNLEKQLSAAHDAELAAFRGLKLPVEKKAKHDKKK